MTMKFFNWMHRKLLHPNVVYSRVPQKQQPDVLNDVKESEADEAVLLSNVLDGILSIGTLGIDSNYNSFPQFEYNKKDKQDQEEEEEEEVKELVLPIVATKHATKLKENEKKRNAEMVVIFELKINNDQNSHNEHITEPLLKDDKEKEGKRITLADLFAVADDLHAEKESLNSTEKSAKTKCIASKWKHNKKVEHEKRKEKPMQKINTTTSSTKQVQQLITKVLKKKVHPEMGVGGAMKEMEKISLVEERSMNKLG